MELMIFRFPLVELGTVTGLAFTKLDVITPDKGSP